MVMAGKILYAAYINRVCNKDPNSARVCGGVWGERKER